MARKFIFPLFIAFFLSACYSIATSTPTLPKTSDNTLNECFINIPFIPEKTKMSEVVSVWGNPTEVQIFQEGFTHWYYVRSDVPYTDIRFQGETIYSANFYPVNCTIEDIVTELGQPEKIEISIRVNSIDSPELYFQSLHYSSLGFYYSRPCDKAQDCFTFHTNDIADRKIFYAPNKKTEDYTENNMYRYIYDWHGYDVDVEEIEDKIKE